MIYKRTKRILLLMLLGVMTFALAGSLSSSVFGQCVDHPAGKTSLKVNNQSSYDLTFFIDMEPVGTAVPAKKLSAEREVAPGEHLLRAMAKLEGQELWVWSINDFPSGQVCTWTIDDYRTRDSASIKYGYGSIFAPKLNDFRRQTEKEKYNVSKKPNRQ